MKKIFKCSILLMVILVAWGVYQYVSITRIGLYSEAKEADVIIVLGAAVWPTGPSPALQARIYHSESIYREGLGEAFILTGGLGKYPPTEAEAMKRKLISLGVPEEILILEDKATNTKENIEYSKIIMEKMKWETAIIVTDVFHLKRALILAEDAGIKAYGAPVKETNLYKNKALKFKYTVREILAISQYYLKGIFN